MLKLTSILKAIGQLYKLLTDPTTLKSNYIKFPNGFKICWGRFDYAKYGDTVQLPITFHYGVLVILPRYNTGTTMDCNFSTDNIIDRSTFLIYAYNVRTGAASVSTTLSGTYVVIGY
nr:MAG TPA: Putative tail fiber protein fold, Tail fiber, receptor [Caudoviricetes sp.]